MALAAGKPLILLRKMFCLMGSVIEGDPRAAAFGPTFELGMIGHKAVVLFAMTGLARRIAHGLQIEVGTPMLAMAGAASERTMGIDTAAARILLVASKEKRFSQAVGIQGIIAGYLLIVAVEAEVTLCRRVTRCVLRVSKPIDERLIRRSMATCATLGLIVTPRHKLGVMYGKGAGGKEIVASAAAQQQAETANGRKTNCPHKSAAL